MAKRKRSKLWRLNAFADLGADVLFLEAPRGKQEMARFCREVRADAANMLEGLTPLLPPDALAAAGFRLAAYAHADLFGGFRDETALSALQSGTHHNSSGIF